MPRESRISKTIKNTTFNLVNQIFSIVLQFVLRTIFIRCLSLEYLGVNGLFTNILTMLSLTELGLGVAIVCNLYKPLAEGDKPAIAKYFQVYKKVYSFIGIIIFVIGIMLVPFLKFLVKDAPNISNLQWIYILYLIDSVASYFFAQYRSLLSADQKDYVNANNRTVFLILQTILQSVVLVVFHSYIWYLIVKIVCNLFSGYVVSLRARKLYPFIVKCEKVKLTLDEMKALITDSTGVLSTRVAMTVLNSTENIIISAFLGSAATAYYSNYSLLIGTVSTAMGILFSAVQASIGNFCVENTKEDNNRMFLNINYIYYCIYGAGAICLYVLLTPFIQAWLGNDFLLAKVTVSVVVLKFYISNARQTTLNFMTVNRLLCKLNLKNIIEVCLSLGLSICLAKQMGMIGIFLGTCISLFTTSLWYEPYVLHKYCLGRGLCRYYLKSVLYFVVVVTGGHIIDTLVTPMFDGTYIMFFVGAIVVATCAVAVVVLPYIGTKEFKYALNMAKQFMKRK